MDWISGDHRRLLVDRLLSVKAFIRRSGAWATVTAIRMAAGPVAWWHGSACIPDGNECSLGSESFGRCLRSTKYPMNSLQFPIADDDSNDLPFGSDHPGGAQFVFADGHVDFIGDAIDTYVYQALSTYDGAEVVDSSAL